MRALGLSRLVAGGAIVASTLFIGVSGATATTPPTPPTSDPEAYPPEVTDPVVVPTTRPLPATGNDGSDTWLRYGAGAVVVGGLMVAGASRRRQGEGAR